MNESPLREGGNNRQEGSPEVVGVSKVSPDYSETQEATALELVFSQITKKFPGQGSDPGNCCKRKYRLNKKVNFLSEVTEDCTRYR
jgi:hypothetical protein